jgi:Icc-related predicted phosphoesterase
VLLFDIFVFQVLLEKIMKHVYDYVIVGGGLTEAAAVEGTREFDVTESVLLIWEVNHMLF